MDPLRGIPLLEDLPDLEGKRVLVRVDFNVPLHIGVRGQASVADDFRITAACRRCAGCRTRARRSWLRRISVAPAERRTRAGRWTRSETRLAVLCPGVGLHREPALRPGREGQRPRPSCSA